MDITLDDLKNKINNEIIKPTYIEDITSSLKWRKTYKKIGNYTILFSKLFCILGAMIAFCVTYFDNKYISLVSGCISLFGVLLHQYSEFSFKQSSKETSNTNEILTKLGLESISLPDITDDLHNTNKPVISDSENKNQDQEMRSVSRPRSRPQPQNGNEYKV